MLHQAIVDVLQEGEYILREGEPLATGSKFYMIEEGTVECCKTIQVPSAHQSYYFAEPICNYPWQTVCGMHLTFHYVQAARLKMLAI